MDHDDFKFEPIPGLPERPPQGETLLWQGRPAAFALAREAYKVNWIAGYFALIVLWRGSMGWADGGLPMALAYGLPYVGMGVLTYLLLLLGAFWQAHATIYTITTARVILRIGAALSVTLNLPFKQLESAALDLRKSGSGTIALKMKQPNRISKLVCWPHIRPWKWRGEPAMRCIPDAERVARILTEAAEARLSVPSIARAEAAMPAQAVPAA
ncbi:photosynthetic complex putative assembly protein PuhB [Cereibacter azotoformans]|uniref:photosynthetic complex putative assembly protein PuhB n=1 Tax=Cereibacter azotoformans TaxID=43057 RepID=UPI003B2155FB